MDRVLPMVPGRWQRTHPRRGHPVGNRVVPCSPTGPTGGGCWSVLSPVRAGATQQSVALSLRNRIRQRATRWSRVLGVDELRRPGCDQLP